MRDQILLAYYVGAYGPTIRIDVQLIEDLVAVRNLFERLMFGEVVEEDIGRPLNCRLDSFRSLVVRSVQHPPRLVLELESSGPQGPVFLWSNVSEAWLDCVEKTDVMVVDNSPGHQYLTTEGVDDVLVELCFLEESAIACALA